MSASRRLLLIPLLLVLMVAESSAPATAAPARTLQIISLTGNRIGVEGTGWTTGPIALSLSAGPWVVGAKVRPTASGSFLIAAFSVNRCAGLVVRGADLHGHRRTTSTPPLTCAVPLDRPQPRLQMLHGTLLHPAITRILARRPQSVTVVLGDALYLWEPGATVPAFSPTVDPHFLALIAQGRTPPRLCAQVDCAEGFYWEWLAIRAGETGITLSAACRRATPPCMLPDFLIQVRIAGSPASP